MKKLISMATPNIANDCEEFIANHQDYARVQGFEYECHSEKHKDFQDLHVVYSRLGFLLDALEDSEFAVWADADVAFMNFTWDITSLLNHGKIDIGRYLKGQPITEKSPGAWLAGYSQKNWHTSYLCFGLIVFRSNWLSKSFLREVVRRARENPETDNAREQYYAYDVLSQINNQGVRMCTTNEIGCFSAELWNDGTRWQPGFPTVHLAGANWDARKKLFRQNYKQLVKRG